VHWRCNLVFTIGQRELFWCTGLFGRQLLQRCLHELLLPLLELYVLVAGWVLLVDHFKQLQRRIVLVLQSVWEWHLRSSIGMHLAIEMLGRGIKLQFAVRYALRKSTRLHPESGVRTARRSRRSSGERSKNRSKR
jgi:hypothetical protein